MIGTKVRILWGRNQGQIGTILLADKDMVFVDFDREILIDEGFGSHGWYQDGYWSGLSGIEVLEEETKDV